MILIVVFYLKRITLMALMVTHVLLFLKGNFNPSWMFKGHAILRSRLQSSNTHGRAGQREGSLLQGCMQYKLAQLIRRCMSEVLQNTRIMTQKFQLGKHSIRKVIKYRRNLYIRICA